MPRQKKDHANVTLRMDKGLYERLCDHIEHSGVTKTAAIEKALVMYLDDYDRKMKILEEHDKKMK